MDVIRAQAAKELPNYVNFNKTIVHVDKKGLSREEGCEGLYVTVLEQDVLSMCDVLVISKSGYSQMAIYRRRENQIEQTRKGRQPFLLQRRNERTGSDR